MTRLALSNRLFEINYTQFKKMTGEFLQACSESFGADCRLEIHPMSASPLRSNFIEDEGTQLYMQQVNRENTIAELSSLSEMTKDLWDRCAYVEVSVRPRDDAKAPANAWGHLEFSRSKKPKTATYYIQPDAPEAIRKIDGRHPLMIRGDGYGTLAL